MNIISTVAKLITEDPDIFMEFDQSMDLNQNPMNVAEINKQARNAMKAPEPDEDIKKQQQNQDKIKKQEEQQRQKLLEPQLNKMHELTQDLGDSIQQDQNAETTNNNDIDSQLAELSTIINMFGKQI